MPNYTTNLNLEKPLQSEQYNVDVFNANADKIDAFAGQVPARALTADKLTTGANINGVNFKGDTNIITGLGLHSSTEVYAQNNLAYKVIDDNVVVKRSLVNNNTGDNFDDSDYWEDVALGGGSGYQLFDIVMKDHVLSYEETLGFAPLGTYVYKEAIAGTRYGYPSFYQKCVDEYNNGTSAYMSSNINIVGSLIDNDGVLSGFSASNWGYAGTITISQGDTWEYVMKLKVPSFASNQSINSFGNEGDKGMAITITTSGAFAFFASSNGSTWDIANNEVSVNTLVANTDYYIKTYFTGEAYKVDVSTTGAFTGEETNYITHTSSTSIHTISTTPIGIGGWYTSGVNTNYVLGSIDLNSSYININGTRWWTGTNECIQSSNKHRFYDIADKATFDNMYAITGEAWYYGIDTTNERIFLPRSTRFKNGTTSDVGRYQPAGLPDIICDTYKEDGNIDNHIANAGGTLEGTTWRASAFNSIYGASDTVEYSSTKLIPYMVVGNVANESAVTDVVDITTSENDTIPLGYSTYSGEVLNPRLGWLKSEGQWNSGSVYATFYNEAVTNLNNDFGAGKIVEHTDIYTDYDLVINQVNETFRLPLLDGSETLPGDINNRVVLSLGASGDPYTQPKNGYYELSVTSNVSYWYLENTTTGICSGATNAGNGYTSRLFVKANKDDVIKVFYQLSPTAYDFYFVPAVGNGSLYYKVANAVQNLELLDVGEVLEVVQRIEAQPHIIDTYQNGASFYRIYSDGWCIQGGQVTISSSGVTTVSLLKEFKDTTYVCFKNYGSNKSSNATDHEVSIYNQTTTSFDWQNDANDTSLASWRAEGYLAEGEY